MKCKNLFASSAIAFLLAVTGLAIAEQKMTVRERIVLSEKEDHPEIIAFSPDGLFLASTITGGAKIWRLDSRKLHRKVIHQRHNKIWSICFSPDAKILVTGCHSIKAWSVGTGKNVWTIWSEMGGITAVAFNSDGTLLAAAGKNKIICYEVPSGEITGRFEGHSDLVTGLAFSSDDS
jgi:WD40 repeat protein